MSKQRLIAARVVLTAAFGAMFIAFELRVSNVLAYVAIAAVIALGMSDLMLHDPRFGVVGGARGLSTASRLVIVAMALGTWITTVMVLYYLAR